MPQQEQWCPAEPLTPGDIRQELNAVLILLTTKFKRHISIPLFPLEWELVLGILAYLSPETTFPMLHPNSVLPYFTHKSSYF